MLKNLSQQPEIDCLIYQPEKIDNLRIKQLVELNSDRSPFDRLPNLTETFDEDRKLSDRAKFCPPKIHPVPLAHQSKYLLIYYDGQLVEVSNLEIQEIVFRNITPNCYQQLNYQHDWTPFNHEGISNKE
jgi:hypothetical protein